MGGEIEGLVPLMPKNLQLRIFSGLVLGSIAVFSVIKGGLFFISLILVAIFLMSWEWNKISGAVSFRFVVLQILNTLLSSVFILSYYYTDPWVLIFAFASLLIWLCSALLGRHRPTEDWLVFCYMTFSAIALIWLRFHNEMGAIIVLWLFAVIWSTDTAAYFTGKFFGGAKLAPKISPGKTWTGALGGFLAALMTSVIISLTLGFKPIGSVLILAAILSISAQIGDLLISSIKRNYSVKDFGQLIPGHGGALDRLDSTVMTIPVMALILYFNDFHGLVFVFYGI